MYLLTTDRAELRRCPRVPKVYAILSHVWRKQPREQSLEDIKRIVRICKDPREHPSKYVSEKIWKSCQWARQNGFKRIWIDTCCIDKSSSAELSEAINSMFDWYTRASICYAYLHDVPSEDDPFAKGSAFRKSLWFKRGWTLQELLAPKDVMFLAQDWTPLTTKRRSPKLIAEITGISEEVLMGEVRLWDVTVAQRMSWAADRRTTRIEDQAYCLMGMFNVHIPPIYGEGDGAFIRLQEAIMRSTSDHTLFAWGSSRNLPETVLHHRPSLYPTPNNEDYVKQSRLLADSPSAFKNVTGDIQLVSIDKFAQQLNIEPKTPTFQLNSYGILSYLPLVRFRNRCTVMLLPCKIGGKQGDSFLGLLLRDQGEGRAWCLGTCVVLGQTGSSDWYVNCGQMITSITELLFSRHFDNVGLQLRDCTHATIVRYVLVPRSWMDLPELGSENPRWEYVTLAHRQTHVEVRAPGSVSLPSRSPHTTTLPPSSLVRKSRVYIPLWVVRNLESKKFFLLNEPVPQPGVPFIRQLRSGETSLVIFRNYDLKRQFSLHLHCLQSANGRVLCTVFFSSGIGLYEARSKNQKQRPGFSMDRAQPSSFPPARPVASYWSPKEQPAQDRANRKGATVDAKPHSGLGGFIDEWTEEREFADEAGTTRVQLTFQPLGDIHSDRKRVIDQRLYMADILVVS